MSEIGRKIELTINDSSLLAGNEINEDSYISIKKDKKSGYITIEANKSGFESLAKIFIAFADNQLEDNFHLHLDAKTNNLDGQLDYYSDNIVISKIEKNLNNFNS